MKGQKIFSRLFFLLVAAVVALGYFYAGFHVEKNEFAKLMAVVLLLSAGGFYLHQNCSDSRILLGIGIIFRAVLLFAVPFLSQDFYRFIWDGELVLKGINPYQFTPNELMANTNLLITDKALLYEKMGSLSAKYNSNYPPVNQLFFAIAASLGTASLLAKVLVMKAIVIFADVGTFLIGRKLLLHLNIEPKRINLYFLNPLIIIELSGNLHFEGVMIFFLLAGIYLLLKKKMVMAAIYTGLAIATKLVPLMLLPFYIRQMKFRQNLIFFAMLCVSGIGMFLLCFGKENISHYLATIALWFNNFEFNASIYFVVKELGFAWKGYNMIAVFGKMLSAIAVLIILLLTLQSFKKNAGNFFAYLTLSFATYLMLSTTIHPWYLSTLLALSIFTHFRFVLLWCLLIFLSYHAYVVPEVKELWYVLVIEYLPVYTLAFVEIRKWLVEANFPNRLKHR